MRRLMWFAGGMAVGFVLGTRAGRETYDKLIATTNQFMERPDVQEAMGVAQEQASRLTSWIRPAG